MIAKDDLIGLYNSLGTRIPIHPLTLSEQMKW